MLRTRILALASLFALICLLLPGAALASTRCQCNNGSIVISMDDGDDACDGLGGGQQWQPSDAGDDDDSDGVVETGGEASREERRESTGR
jgi:hypothetical protein